MHLEGIGGNFQAMSLKTSDDRMSSPDGQGAPWSPRNPGERILMLLKMHGVLTSAALGTMLGTTSEAARQQLLRLAEAGLVTAASRAKGVGRPTQSWQLAPRAQHRFPDTHAALTVQLLDIVRSSLGEAALDTIIATREANTRKAYHAVTDRATNLRDRVAALVELRTAEGYMAAWNEADDGSLLLVENHCPICAAAAACQGFCRAEIEVFSDVLGPDVVVTREEHIVSGGRRCSYSIREIIR